jgi:hypothetical protein
MLINKLNCMENTIPMQVDKNINLKSMQTSDQKKSHPSKRRRGRTQTALLLDLQYAQLVVHGKKKKHALEQTQS